MSTRERFAEEEITKENHIFSRTRTTIESAFYGNNVVDVASVEQAYRLAEKSSATIVTDLPIIHTKELGLPDDAKMIVDNHGEVVGRTAKARRRIGLPESDDDKLDGVLREAIYSARSRKFYKTDVVVGLDEEFMLKAHLAIAEGFEVNLLSYMLNFQFLNGEYEKRYENSKQYDEGDIYLYADPSWHDAAYPDGLVIIDAKHNAAAVLGLRYFGELKKATLTLAWATAHRNGYAACHGGEKAFHFKDKDDKVFAFYGLSGSGKSTLTHAKHNGKFDITVLHDDAFVINRKDGNSIALEPSYFDKTNDYLPGTKETNYFTTVMNVGVTLDADGKKVLVTEDLRNGNGRTIKSRYASVNRVDCEKAPITSIFWIMKDNSLPPVVKLDDPVTAATFGVTLATKRSTAENVAKTARDALVIEPFADPFRAYLLSEDYADFKELFENGVDCYIVNTADFNGRDIDKNVTLKILEDIATGADVWKPFGPLDNMSYMPLDGYALDFSDEEYKEELASRFEIRRDWIERYEETHPHAPLPEEITDCLNGMIKKIK